MLNKESLDNNYLYNLNIFQYIMWSISNSDFNMIILFLLILYFLKKLNYYLFSNLIILWLLLIVDNKFVIIIQNLNLTNLINVKLLNGIFFIHPWFNYVFLSLFISYFINTLIEFSNNNNLLLLKTKIKQYLRNLFYLMLASISLGSWWAQQELDWGGWWSWDMIEIISLLYLMLIIYSIHVNKINSTRVYKYCLTFFLNIFFLFSLLIRHNQILSIHNFLGVTDIIQWYFIYYFILTCIIIFYFFFINILKQKKKNLLEILLFIYINFIFFVIAYKYIVYYYQYEDHSIILHNILKYYFVLIILIYSLFFLKNKNILNISILGLLDFLMFSFFFHKLKNFNKFIFLFHYFLFLFIMLLVLTNFTWAIVFENQTNYKINYFYNSFLNLFLEDVLTIFNNEYSIIFYFIFDSKDLIDEIYSIEWSIISEEFYYIINKCIIIDDYDENDFYDRFVLIDLYYLYIFLIFIIFSYIIIFYFNNKFKINTGFLRYK